MSIGLVFLVAVLVAADFGLRYYIQRRAGQELAASLRLSEPASVSIGGFPFLLHFLQGGFPSAAVEGSDLQVEGVTFADVRLELRDVTFPPARVVGGEPSTIRARSGEGTLSLTGDEVTAILREHGTPVTVRIEAGDMRIRSEELPGAVRARASVDGGSVRLTVGGAVPLSFAIDLPPFVEGLTLTDVRIEGSLASVSFSLEEPAFEVGQPS